MDLPHKDILRLVVLMLGVSKLLTIAKDIGNFSLTIVSEMFFQLINHSIVLQLQGRFKNTYSLINLKYQPLKVVRSSLLASKPSSTYTLIVL
jgi:hypothetical protein